MWEYGRKRALNFHEIYMNYNVADYLCTWFMFAKHDSACMHIDVCRLGKVEVEQGEGPGASVIGLVTQCEQIIFPRCISSVCSCSTFSGIVYYVYQSIHTICTPPYTYPILILAILYQWVPPF